MGKKDQYRDDLRHLPRSEWENYLLKFSGLPGPRGNIELAQAAAEEGNSEQFESWLTPPILRHSLANPGGCSHGAATTGGCKLCIFLSQV